MRLHGRKNSKAATLRLQESVSAEIKGNNHSRHRKGGTVSGQKLVQQLSRLVITKTRCCQMTRS